MPLRRDSALARPAADQPVPAHELCWAKTTEADRPGICVLQHCRTAGIVARLLTYGLPHWLTASLSARAGVCLAALHDVGKVTPGFQRKCTHWLAGNGLSAADLAGEEDHAKVSQKALQDFLGENSPLRFWAAIVGAHHGRLKGEHLTPVSCGHDGGPAWTAERRRLIEELVAEFGPLPS